MFSKILIANRGEIAVRLIQACQELGIETVAVYSEADAEALHTVLADEAICIGPAAPQASYLQGDRIIEVALEHECEAIHPGYGFLSENAPFARAVRAAGLQFVGPGAEAIEAMGDKIRARKLMREAGIPVTPGYAGGTSAGGTSAGGTRDEEFLKAAEALGYPVVVKAAAGGGGKGMRVVREPAALPDALGAARREAQGAFGDDTIYLEAFLPEPRHVEFQILADEHGTVVHLFERECSVQRRHQKIIEETPSPLLDDELRARMGAAAVAAAEAVGYVNAGTVEFLVDAERKFYFLEMNTRLQVEHPITEMVVGVDLVRAQLAVAAGARIGYSQQDLAQRGHAIECRLYAEDPASGFLPATGMVLRAGPPIAPHVRVDTGIATGDVVGHQYDPMLAKLVVWGEDRDQAIDRMVWALDHYVLLGVTTNVPFLRDLVTHEAFRRSEVTTDFVERTFMPWQPADEALPDEVLIAAALFDSAASQTSARAGAPDGDPYSPWALADGFRIGSK